MKEAIAALPINLAAMLVGALAMAGALSETGAGDVIGNALAAAVGGIDNGYILGSYIFLYSFCTYSGYAEPGSYGNFCTNLPSDLSGNWRKPHRIDDFNYC